MYCRTVLVLLWSSRSCLRQHQCTVFKRDVASHQWLLGVWTSSDTVPTLSVPPYTGVATDRSSELGVVVCHRSTSSAGSCTGMSTSVSELENVCAYYSILSKGLALISIKSNHCVCTGVFFFRWILPVRGRGKASRRKYCGFPSNCQRYQPWEATVSVRVLSAHWPKHYCKL